MGYQRNKFAQKGFDAAEYQRYIHKCQAEYIRVKLRSVYRYWQGQEFDQIAGEYGLNHKTVRSYVNTYLAGGFALLCQPTVRAQRSQLSQPERTAFKAVLLSKRPFEVGLEGNIWTGQLRRKYLQATYQVSYKSGIYDLLQRMGLSHQKAHCDYGNAKAEEQAVFMSQLKETILAADEKTAVVKFDEFSVCDKPTAYYGWAEKNTRPRVVTNEKKSTHQWVLKY